MASEPQTQALSQEIDRLLEHYLSLLSQYDALRYKLSGVQASVRPPSFPSLSAPPLSQPLHPPLQDYSRENSTDSLVWADPAKPRPRKFRRPERNTLWSRSIR